MADVRLLYSPSGNCSRKGTRFADQLLKTMAAPVVIGKSVLDQILDHA